MIIQMKVTKKNIKNQISTKRKIFLSEGAKNNFLRRKEGTKNLLLKKRSALFDKK